MATLTGKISSVAFTESGRPLVTFEMYESLPAMKMAQKYKDGTKVSLKVTKHSDKRSLDANAYYWQLLTKLAAVQKISNNYCHNLMLSRYGVPEEIDGKPMYIVIPDTEEADRRAEESETYHIKPTSNVREGKDGVMYRTYMLLKGSSQMDTAEFSRVISGLVDECKQCGIETLSPAELARMFGGGK
jgi:hypothetical protein